jgi:hypothetical protein
LARKVEGPGVSKVTDDYGKKQNLKTDESAKLGDLPDF